MATYTGLAVRHAPADSHKSQRSVEGYHTTHRQQVWTLRGAVREHYCGYDIKAYDASMTWLAKHAMRIYERYRLHSGGQTYER